MAIARLVPEVKTVGLCHSVQGTAEMLADDLGEKVEDIVFQCAGINHMAFYLKFANASLMGLPKIYTQGYVNSLKKLLPEQISSPAEPENYDRKAIGCLT